MKTVLLTAIAVMLYTVGLAQPNYKKASIITNDGTQIQGWINYREWSENPSLISFKTKKEANEAKEYVIADLKQFEN